MGYQTGILEACQDWGLVLGKNGPNGLLPHEGWQERGNESFNPRGSVNHHTAGAATGLLGSINVLLYGRRKLPGPLANAGLARNACVHLLAAGRANHAGSGGWRGLSGNSSVWGLEVEHVGYSWEPVTDAQWEAMWRWHRACADFSGFGIDKVCQHFEWTNRKIDFVKDVTNPHVFRVGVAGIHKPGTEDDPMTPENLTKLINAITEAHNYTKAEVQADIERFAMYVMTGETNKVFNPNLQSMDWMRRAVTLKSLYEATGYFGREQGKPDGPIYYFIGHGFAKVPPSAWQDWINAIEMVNRLDTDIREVPSDAFHQVPTLVPESNGG